MDDGPGALDRAANLDELRAHAAEYARSHPDRGLGGFLEEVALVSEADGLEEGQQGVRLMTLHACKGLEFPFVFVAGLEDELLPHLRATSEHPEDGVEEERRLFYVGMTRARERLFLSRANVRNFFGSGRWQLASPFLEEIPPHLVERTDPPAEEVHEAYEPREEDARLSVGDRVEHDHFGVGRVEQLSGSGVNARAVVRFNRHGTRELLLCYAKLRLLA